MVNTQEKIYQIALSQTKGIGYVLANKLMASLGSAQSVFHSSARELSKALGGDYKLAKDIISQKGVEEAETLLADHIKAHIQVITPWEQSYPERLKHTTGAPTLLFCRGKTALNEPKVISIVGTRRATGYGKQVVEHLLRELSTYPVLIVSGLAYGIDIHAHRVAMELGLPTLAVVAGGVDKVYPLAHKKIAEAMLEEGGLLSEHPMNTQVEVHRFAARNRIIAGMADATVVVEAGEGSGALITAHYANEYNREVFAVAGGVYDKFSVGCHQLVKKHQASLLTDASDIIEGLNWHKDGGVKRDSLEVFRKSPDLNQVERGAVETIGQLQREVHIDDLSYQMQIPLNQLASVLLQLELKQVVRFMPGRKIRLAS